MLSVALTYNMLDTIVLPKALSVLWILPYRLTTRFRECLQTQVYVRVHRLR